MDKVYNHKDHEEKIYKLWEKEGAFKPKPSKTKFSIVLPPPNANAPLHYGHSMYTVEDVLIRYHRMLGDETLWLPGADHAGFETQVVYEKYLEKEDKSRFDFDRETLYKNIWDFVQTNRGTMEGQLKKLGFSLDWSRRKFTLDDEIVKTVYKTFKKLFDQGLVYRDARLVNYCTKHGTAFSDLEVDHIEKQDKLYFVKYKIVGTDEFITVATTRPETIFGDVAIAVNPKDKRYLKFKNKFAINPLNQREIPILFDSYVDINFGTGALKITPAHDENDFLIGKKYNLEPIQVIGFDGRLSDKADKFKGLKVLPAREAVVELLESSGVISKIEDYIHTVGTCYKCGNTLEPLPLPQWYIKTKSLAKPAIDAVKKKQINIIPKRFEKVYFNWMNNIHDWNISRQVVWGIRIPAYKCNSCGEWIVTEGEDPVSCIKCDSKSFIQDPDTFDTWFSSGQWPFATLGFPDEKDYKNFYPITVMETGYDILFFWVARMIMLGLYITNDVPFKNVYLHGIVRDSKGQKMSKSKGNVINPLEIIEKYGADSLRMSLMVGAGAGNDQNFSENKVLGFRNFSNKIWNAARFVKEFDGKSKENISLNKNIKETIVKVTKYLDEYKINQAAEYLYKRFWFDFCDKQIEKAKLKKIGKEQLQEALKTYLKLLHPFMPFVTEAVWKELGNKELLITSSWPITK